MLLGECNCAGGDSVILPDRIIGLVDSDDGVLEWVDNEDLLHIIKCGIPLYNIYQHRAAVVASPLLSMCHYTVGDKLFIFDSTEVLVFFGNDYMIHLEIRLTSLGPILYINDKEVGERRDGGCFGIPGRLSINSEFFIRLFENFLVSETFTLEKSKAQYRKGCRQYYLRKFLF